VKTDEKILATTELNTRLDQEKFTLAALAGIMAMIGLFLNNTSIVIGTMLISPLLGPIYALTVFVAVSDGKMTVPTGSYGLS